MVMYINPYVHLSQISRFYADFRTNFAQIFAPIFAPMFATIFARVLANFDGRRPPFSNRPGGLGGAAAPPSPSAKIP